MCKNVCLCLIFFNTHIFTTHQILSWQVKGYQISQVLGSMEKSVVGSSSSTARFEPDSQQYVEKDILGYPYEIHRNRRWFFKTSCPECKQVNLRQHATDVITCMNCSIQYCYNCFERLNKSIKKSHLVGGMCLKERCSHWKHSTADCPCIAKRWPNTPSHIENYYSLAMNKLPLYLDKMHCYEMWSYQNTFLCI